MTVDPGNESGASSDRIEQEASQSESTSDTEKLPETEQPVSDLGAEVAGTQAVDPSKENTQTVIESEVDPFSLSDYRGEKAKASIKPPGVPYQNRYGGYLVFGGFCFFGAALFLFASSAYWLLFDSQDAIVEALTKIVEVEVASSDILFIYISYYASPILCSIAALFCTMIGYLLLNQAGAIGREVMPVEDQNLLQSLGKSTSESVSQYIKLKSLIGITGFFTKIGITGLPLATISLTLIFGSLAIISINDADSSSKFFDFANLTLGAFLGSYVQKQKESPTVKEEKKS